MSYPYLFVSKRLGFRQWHATDMPVMAAINSDPEVMRFFPATQTREQTESFIARMQQQMADQGYCYFATELLSTGALIGFIGLSYQTFLSPYTPCIDIGWRLSRNAWNNGYATEGALRCLKYGFEDLHLNSIRAFAPKVNVPSLHIMQKIGMKQIGQFPHPLLLNDDRLRNCAAYEINYNDFCSLHTGI